MPRDGTQFDVLSKEGITLPNWPLRHSNKLLRHLSWQHSIYVLSAIKINAILSYSAKLDCRIQLFYQYYESCKVSSNT